MKIKTLFALGAVATVAGVANAQTPPKAPSQSIEDLLKQNSSSLDSMRAAGVQVFTNLNGTGFSTAPGSAEFKPKFVVQIVRQDSRAALLQLAAVLGANIVIDPAIQFLPAKTRNLYFSEVKEDVFDDVSNFICRDEPIEKWKSAAGTYFFAAKPTAKPAVTATDLWKESGGLKLRLESGAQTPNPDPFVINIAPFTKPRVVPQPGWEKYEFNGNAVYFIPVPTNVRSTESADSK